MPCARINLRSGTEFMERVTFLAGAQSEKYETEENVEIDGGNNCKKAGLLTSL